MYGFIHTSAREMVLSEYGPEVWAKIIRKGSFEADIFLSSHTYDDADTIRLLQVIGNETGYTLDETLAAFGRYWIKYTSQSSYASVYTLYGKTLVGFIENLNRMHDAIQVTIPSAVLPTFECTDCTDTHIDVLYFSKRKGLEAMVVGLFSGLLEYFKLQGNVENMGPQKVGILFRIHLDTA